MQHLPPKLGRTLGWCATFIGVVILLPLMAFLIVTLRMVLLPIGLGAAAVGLALLFLGPPRIRAWFGATWADGERR